MGQIESIPDSTPRLDRLAQAGGDQPFTVAEVFTGIQGRYVELKDTIAGFKGLLGGQYDDLPEMAFYMVGDINEVMSKADELAKQVA